VRWTRTSLRICAGARWFQRNEWPLHGFVAPAWLMSDGTWDAVTRMSFAYTCTLREVYDLRNRQTVHSHSLVYSARSGWRRALSRPVNRMVAKSIAANPLVRLELHPWDADYPAMRQSWQHLLGRFLEQRPAMTMVDALRR
jgi:predicted deacetylase